MNPVKEPDNTIMFRHPQPTNTSAAPRVNDFAVEKGRAQPDIQQQQAVMSEKPTAHHGDEEPVRFMGKTGTSLIWTITFFATVGFSLFGYDQGLMSGIIASKQFNDEFPATKQSSTSDVYHGTIQGTVTSCYEVGAFLGAMSAFFIGERLGRRKMMFMGGSIMIIGTIIQITAFGSTMGGFGQFIFGRVVTGVGNGMNTATIPSWVAECSKSHNRGFLVCIEASTVAVGTFVAYWIDFGLSFVNSSVSWRFPTAFQIVFALTLMFGVAFLPESPAWLLAHGREEEALKICAALNGVGIHDPATIAQKELILDGINAARRAKVAGSRELLQGGKKQNLRRMLIGASSQLFQQIGGCNAVIYYSTVLFENQIGLETQLSLILGGVLSTVYALSALASFMLVEKAGRRSMFIWGTVGQAVSMFITFGCLMPQKPEPAKGAAFGLFLFIAFFGATWLPLPWLYPAELNSLGTRTQANAVSTMTNWISNFLVVQVLPTMTASINQYTFLLFGAANILFLPIIYIFYPETTGRTLEELDLLFAHSFLAGRRPTLIADELPQLNDHQIKVMTERYDIHNNNDIEAPGPGSGDLDLSIPAPHPESSAHLDVDESGSPSVTSTRVPSRAESLNEQVAKGSKNVV